MSSVLQAKVRNEFRRSDLKKIRDSGNIPAVVYGAKVESKPVYLRSADLTKSIREVGRNGVISLDVNGSKQDVMLIEFQADALRKELIHADFLAINKSSKITVDVRLDLIGEPVGVKDGGVLQQPLHQISISSTPENIPHQVEVDVTNLQVGETVTIADINTNVTYTIHHDADEVIASILPPLQEEEINSGEQQAGGHPENEEGRETTPVGK